MKAINETIQQFLRLFNQAPPSLSLCNPQNPAGYQANNAIRKHSLNVVECLQFKCQGNNNVYKQLRSYIGKQWKHDLMAEWKVKDHLTPKETATLQTVLGSSDKPWNNFKREFNKIWGKRVFASHAKTNTIRKQHKPRSGMVAEVNLQSDTNKYDSRQRHMFTIYYMRECEIVCKGLDKLINSNDFVWIDLFGDEILVQYGGDKAKKGGYYDTIAIGGVLFSVKNSMVALYIPGNVTENNSNLHKCYQLMNYNKIDYWRALSKNPCILSLVFYCADEDSNIHSRMVHSCVVSIKPSKQVMLNTYQADNRFILSTNPKSPIESDCKFAQEQFDFEWSLSKSASKQKSNQWRSALKELIEWENLYERPKDLAVLSDTERKGHFNKRARS